MWIGKAPRWVEVGALGAWLGLVSSHAKGSGLGGGLLPPRCSVSLLTYELWLCSPKCIHTGVSAPQVAMGKG